MADYVYPGTGQRFGDKDPLSTGDPNKIIKGVDYDVQFDLLASVSAGKMNNANPIFSGVMSGGVIGGTTTIDCGTFAP